MEKVYWEHFDHQADIGIRGVAADMATAFEQAGLALTAVITEVEKLSRYAKSKLPVRLITMSSCLSTGSVRLSMRWLQGVCCFANSRLV